MLFNIGYSEKATERRQKEFGVYVATIFLIDAFQFVNAQYTYFVKKIFYKLIVTIVSNFQR